MVGVKLGTLPKVFTSNFLELSIFLAAGSPIRDQFILKSFEHFLEQTLPTPGVASSQKGKAVEIKRRRYQYG